MNTQTLTRPMVIGSTPDPRHRWKILALGIAANAAFAAAIGGIPTTALVLRAQYQLTSAELGWVLGMLGLGIALSELPWGMLTDRLGDRAVLLWGLGATAVWCCIAYVMNVSGTRTTYTFPLLLGVMLVLGVLGGSVNGASGRAILTWFRDHERGLAMSLRQTAVPGGGAIGAFVLPRLAASCGYGSVYLALACALSLAYIMTLFWLLQAPNSSPAKDQSVASGSRRIELANPLRSPSIWRIASGMSALCVPQVAILAVASLYLHDKLGWGVADCANAVMTMQMGAIVSRIASGWWVDRHGQRRQYLRICATVTALIFALAGGLAQIWDTWHSPILIEPILVLLVLGGIVASAWHGVAYTELGITAGAERAGTALGLGNTTVFAAFFLTPVLATSLSVHVGWSGVWWATAASAVLAWVLFPKSGPEHP